MLPRNRASSGGTPAGRRSRPTRYAGPPGCWSPSHVVAPTVLLGAHFSTNAATPGRAGMSSTGWRHGDVARAPHAARRIFKELEPVDGDADALGDNFDPAVRQVPSVTDETEVERLCPGPPPEPHPLGSGRGQRL